MWSKFKIFTTITLLLSGITFGLYHYNSILNNKIEKKDIEIESLNDSITSLKSSITSLQQNYNNLYNLYELNSESIQSTTKLLDTIRNDFEAVDSKRLNDIGVRRPDTIERLSKAATREKFRMHMEVLNDFEN